MSTDQMRLLISEQYSGPAWKDKVRRMPDTQVCAVYYSMKRSGRFDKPKKSKKDEEYRQMTIFDYI